LFAAGNIVVISGEIMVFYDHPFRPRMGGKKWGTVVPLRSHERREAPVLHFAQPWER